MKEITFSQIQENKFRLLGKFSSSDFSKVILMIQMAEDKLKAKYYLMDFILYNQNTDEGQFSVSFWDG